MSAILVVNAAPHETRVALLHGGLLTEVHHERPDELGIVGNIYQGRVIKVLPGMEAAFVEIGLDRAAFLYRGDLVAGHLEIEEEEDRPGEDAHKGTADARRSMPPIDQLIRSGQDLMVQVSKEPLGTKGPRVTTNLTLPGSHLVLMPHVDRVGISRRITDEQERLRLEGLVEGLRPPGVGFIVRTAAEGQGEEALQADMKFLLALWNDVVQRKAEARPPALLYRDLDVVLRALRDLCSEDLKRVVVDDEEELTRIDRFVRQMMPNLANRVQLYEGRDPIFDVYGVEVELHRALDRRVWLRSGGYIVIEETEALTSIDVNTGRFTGRRNLEETIVKTNLEAVREIVYQLRLRNIGGIIVIDFIDMERSENRERVYRSLTNNLRFDRAKCNVLEISEMGLVEMTRKRVRESLRARLTEPCFYCEGRGYLRSSKTVVASALREIQRVGSREKRDSVVVHAHRDLIDLLFVEHRPHIERLEQQLGKHIVLIPVASFHIEDYDIIGADTGLSPRCSPVQDGHDPKTGPGA